MIIKSEIATEAITSEADGLFTPIREVLMDLRRTYVRFSNLKGKVPLAKSLPDVNPDPTTMWVESRYLISHKRNAI